MVLTDPDWKCYDEGMKYVEWLDLEDLELAVGPLLVVQDVQAPHAWSCVACCLG